MADALRDGNGTPTMMIKDAETGEIKPLDTSMLTPPVSTTAWGEITGEITDQEDLQSALGGKVAGNTAITGATKTKITYDAKGLVTGGADATTADIADSTDKRYVTDAQKTVIGNTSNTNTGDQDATDFDIKDLTDSTSLRSTWSGKQDSLGYTAENTSNKVTSISGSSTDTQYPSAKLVYDQLALKETKKSVGSATTAPDVSGTYTLTVDVDTYKEYLLTAQANPFTVAAPTGTPVAGQKLILRFKDNGTARAITWNAAFRAGDLALPTTTVISKTMYVGFEWNATDSKWDLLASLGGF